MKKQLTLLSVLAITSGCVKIPAEWVERSPQANQGASSEKYIKNQPIDQMTPATTNNNNVEWTKNKTNNAYGNSGKAKNNSFDLNNLQPKPTVNKNQQCEPVKKLADANVKKVQKVSNFVQKKTIAKTTVNTQMIYPIDNIRRLPMGQNTNTKVNLKTADILGKDIKFLINKFGTPSKSQQQNSFYIWQYLSKADGLECTLDLTIKDNKVRHIALLGLVNINSQKKCLANIVRYNMEIKN